MDELRQNIFPICSFGRAENVYYQSQGSLCSEDLSSAQVIALFENKSHPIVPSHLLDRPDWSDLGQALAQMGTNPRIQIAYGREWEELADRIASLISWGWGIDLIVDRSLPQLNIPILLQTYGNWRWIIFPLRFFDIKETLQSLVQIEPKKEILLCFLEPREPHSVLLNPDEVVLAQGWLQSEFVTILILKSPSSLDTSFYQDLSLQTYQKNFSSLGRNQRMREAIKQSSSKYPRPFQYFSTLASFILSDSPLVALNALRMNLRANPLQIFSRFWGFIQHTTVYILQRIYYFILSGFHFSRGLGYRLYYFSTRIIHIAFYKTLHGFHFALRVLNQIINFIFWPIKKIYWFSQFQYKSRFEPFLERFKSRD